MSSRVFPSTECQMILSHGTAHPPSMAISLKKEIEIWKGNEIMGMDNEDIGRWLLQILAIDSLTATA